MDAHQDGLKKTEPVEGAASVTPYSADAANGWNRFLGRLLDQTSQPFVITDFAGRLVHVNQAFQKLVGRSAEELRQMTYNELTPDRWRGVSEPYLALLRDTGKAQRFEKAYGLPDGRELPIEVAVDLYCDEQGKPTGYYAFITDIGERKRTEAALRASEERFRRLYDEAPFGYHEIDVDGRILMVNRTECEMLGYTREEMLGRPIYDFLVESQRDLARNAVRERFKGGRPVMSVERCYRTKDGREIILGIENRLTRDAAGNVVSIRSTTQDITWRKQAEAALIASERRARALFEGIEDAIFVHSLDGHILDANPSACRRLGYTREELLQLTTSDIDEPGFATGFEDRLQRQLRDGHLRIEGRHRTKGGRVMPVDINTSTIQLEDQTVVLAVIRDITERKALEETRRQFAEAQLKNAWEIEAKNRQLLQSEARYRQLTEGCLDAIVVTDQRGRITLFNSAAEQSFGYTSQEIVNHPLHDLFACDIRDEVDSSLEEYLRTGSSQLVGQTCELNGCRKTGEVFPLEISLSAIEVSGEIQFMGAIRDQMERQRMRQMLMQSEKLASIGLLSAGVAHEINNPLAYIANNLAVLQRDLHGVIQMIETYEQASDQMAVALPEVVAKARALSEEMDWPYVRENLDRMILRTRDGVQRVATIVQNLRGLARTSPPRKEPALLCDLVSAAIDMVQGRIRRNNIEIKVENLATAKIQCVPSQIGQVILNLLVNAIQAIEETRRQEGNEVKIVIQQHASTQSIEIRDTGCGITADAMDRLFDPFFTTKPVGEGTGLGLSITHGIVTGHGGQLEVESVPGHGSVFRIVLPWKVDAGRV